MASQTRIIGASAAGLLALAALVFYFCTRGPAYGEIACRVTQAGKPLDQVEVIFFPDGPGPRSSGHSDANGFCIARTDAVQTRQEREGAPIGNYKVVLIDWREALRAQHARLHFTPTTQGVMEMPQNAAAGARKGQKLPIRVPEVYNHR